MPVTYFGINSDPDPHYHPTKVINHAYASRYQNLAGNGNLSELGINIGDYAAQTHVKLLVYADDGGNPTPYPAALLLTTAPITITGTGWFTASGLTLAVTLNTWYWLGSVYDGDTYPFAQQSSPTDSHVNDNTVGAYATPPNPFGAVMVDDEDQECIRAGVEAGGTNIMLNII